MNTCPRCKAQASDDANRCPSCFASLTRPQTSRIAAVPKPAEMAAIDTTKQVFIKTTDGEIRGPYAWEAAESLLKHGKIEPYWEVSEDKITWRVAEKLYGFTPNKASSATGESTPLNSDERAWGMPINVFCTLMHLTQLLWLLGLILFIVMWATNSKDQIINTNGKTIVNWYISTFIYGMGIGLVLLIPFIGFLLVPLALSALAICSLVFVVIGAVKAGHGNIWKYPLAITFVH